MLFLSEQEMWQSVTLEDVMDAIEDASFISIKIKNISRSRRRFWRWRW